MSHNIYHDLYLNGTEKEIQRAFTNPEDLNNWWTLRSSGKAEIGTSYNLYFTEQYNWYGEVTLCSDTSFEIEMTTADKDWLGTQFGYKLTAQQDKFIFHFYHKGWRSANHHFKHSSYCWALLLSGMKNYIEKGIIVPFTERS
jgi:hypothetical protein